MPSLKDVMNIDIDTLERMSRNEIAKIVSQMTSAANKRIKRLEAVPEVHSPALDYVHRTTDKGKFDSVRGKDEVKLRNQFLHVKQFLSSKTGNLKGAREYTKKQTENLAHVTGMTTREIQNIMSPAQLKKYWKVLDRMIEGGNFARGSEEFYRAQQVLAQEIKSGDKRRGVDSLYNKLEGILEEQYETNQYLNMSDYV